MSLLVTVLTREPNRDHDSPHGEHAVRVVSRCESGAAHALCAALGAGLGRAAVRAGGVGGDGGRGTWLLGVAPSWLRSSARPCTVVVSVRRILTTVALASAWSATASVFRPSSVVTRFNMIRRGPDMSLEEDPGDGLLDRVFLSLLFDLPGW